MRGMPARFGIGQRAEMVSSMKTRPDKPDKRTGNDEPAMRPGEGADRKTGRSGHAQNGPYTVRQSHSAGGVAYRQRTGGAGKVIEVALIATDPAGRRWQLPKGRLYPSEMPLAAALREVEEETGLETEYESFLKTVRYAYLDTYARVVPERVLKRVDFYLLRVVGGALSDASIEVEKVEWVSTEEALGLLAYEGERDCIRLAMELLYGN
jgi:8-oxo-dGTP pyrophosphatase MutT (NUDIX family)